MSENTYSSGESGAHVGTETSSTRSLGEIVGDITQDMSNLVRQEIDLATSELKREVGKIGKGVGHVRRCRRLRLPRPDLPGPRPDLAAGQLAPLELAALVVALLWGAITAALALKGRQEIKNANPGAAGDAADPEGGRSMGTNTEELSTTPADIEATRADLSRNIDELSDKVSPGASSSAARKRPGTASARSATR